jgi:Reverse transcriptase (RNA-dependent DNA polymerase)
MTCYSDHESGAINYPDPKLYTATNKKVYNHTFKYHEAIVQPDWDDFKISALKEVRTLEGMGTWEEMPESKLPSGKRVLGGTWVFKRKRVPSGNIIKHKARYCVRGDQQISGIDYFESYAPVVAWKSV